MGSDKIQVSFAANKTKELIQFTLVELLSNLNMTNNDDILVSYMD